MNAELNGCVGSLFTRWKQKTLSCGQPSESSRSSSLCSGWAAPGGGVVQAIADRDVYLTNVLKPVCTPHVSFCLSVYFLCMWFCLGRYNLAETFKYCTFFFFFGFDLFFPLLCTVAFILFYFFFLYLKVLLLFLFFKHQCSSTLGRTGGI